MSARLISSRRLRKILPVLAAMVALFAVSAASANAAVTTDEAKGISEHSADLHGTLEPKGPTIYAFEYGTTSSYGHSTEIEDGASGSAYDTIEGLEPNTTYHFRVVQISNITGETLGKDRTFTTEASHAPRFESTGYPIDVYTEDETTDVFTINGFNVNCTEAQFAGSLSGASSQISLTPEYNGCTVKLPILGTMKVTVKTSGCSYTVDALNSGPPYSGNMGVACSGANRIELTYFYNNIVACIYRVQLQTGLAGINLQNVGHKVVRAVSAEFNVTNLAYQRWAGGQGLCGPEKSTASYTGAATLVGWPLFVDGKGP